MNTTPNPYRAATDRARVIAKVARDRFADPETMRVLGDVARHLTAAADSLATYEPSTLPGLAGHDVPIEAWGELFIVETLASDHPATRFPAEITEYVKAPLGIDRPLPFPAPLNPVSARSSKQETELRGELEQLHQDTARADTDVDGWMTDVCTVWRKWMRLAAEVRADNGRPCNQH